MASRQIRRPVGSQQNKVSGAGVAVDSYGGPVIDPTENVLALVDAESKYQNDMREAETRRVNEAAAAETRRIAELSLQKQTFDSEMARVLRANMDSTSTLLAMQLKEVKTDIQIELRSLNQFRWESGGKTTGRSDVFGYIIAAASASAALTVIVSFFLRAH